MAGQRHTENNGLTVPFLLNSEESEVILSKKSANGNGSIRKKSKGRWEGRYTLGFDPKTGKQIQKSIYGKTQQDVREKLTAITGEIDNGTYIEPSSRKVSEWLSEWLRDYIGNVKPSTVKSYQDHVRLNINPYIGDVELSKLTPAMIQRMYNNLMEDKELSPKTVKNIHGVLHRALDQAQMLGYIRVNPTGAVTLPRIEKAKIHPLDEEGVAKFLEAIRGNPYELVFFVDLFTGLRQGEILGLTWDCVDFEAGTLLINKQHSKRKGSKVYEFSSLKNDKPRLLSPANGVMEALKKQKRIQEDWAKAAGSARNNADNLVFTTETGRYLSNQTICLAFKKVVRAIGLDEVRFHDLRHTYAVLSLKAGDDAKTLSENMGHYSAAFTMDVYAYVTPGMRRDSANRMDQYMQTMINPERAG